MSSSLDQLSESDRRELARHHLDSAEAWLRRLINYQLSKAFGPGYFSATFPDDGTPVIPKRIRKAAEKKQVDEPQRFARPVDATTFGDAIKVVVNERLYPPYFRTALEPAYPQGAPVARTFLKRLAAHRNKVQHGGNLSVRALEQCICYSNDLVDSIKAFFVEENVSRQFNVPMFVRVTDSLGNEHHFPPPAEGETRFLDFRGGAAGNLYPGDTLTIEVEVDQSFAGFQVRWLTFSGDRGEGATMKLAITNKHVGELLDVRFEVISAEPWHRLNRGIDDIVDLRYRVLPPR